MYSRLDCLEGVDLGLFLREGADEAGGGEVFLGLRGDVGEHGLDALEALVDLAAQNLHEDAGERQRGERGQSKHGADAQQEVEREDGEQDGVRAVHDAGAEEHADGVEVVGHARHDVAGAALLVVLGGLLFELQEEIVAEVEFDVAGDADEDPAREEQEDALGDGDGDKQPGVEEDLLAGDAMVEVVYGGSDDAGEEYPDGAREHGDDASPDVGAAVAAHVGEKRLQAFEHECVNS